MTLDSSSEVARRHHVHENTVRYRMRRAGEILGRDLGSSRERVAFGLAAFAWLRHG
jgi:DNA-binding PucR family transcriptional regulator